MKTYRITEKEIAGLTPVATGYKMFKNDWTTKYGNYCYAAKGKVLNSVHKVDGDLEECQWGLHFSKLPHECFNVYESVQWNKFAKVEVYDQLIESDKKCVTNTIKIVQVYTFDEFVGLIQKELQNDNISGGNDIRGGNDISGGNDIRGGNDISGGNYIWGALNCEGISRCIFCYDFSGKLNAFNKPITEDRFNELFYQLNNFGWYPKFNNAEQLKGDLQWYETNIPAIVAVDNATAWSFMPKKMLDYIMALPEFDAEIFYNITGIDCQ